MIRFKQDEPFYNYFALLKAMKENKKEPPIMAIALTTITVILIITIIMGYL